MSGIDTVTCLSDLGSADESVGLIHSIIRQAAPHAAVIDLCHHIDPHDTRTAALMLVRSVPHLAPGVVLASVGQRLDREAIAVSVGDGQSMLIGPDNGVLAAAAAAVGGADAAVRISASDGAAGAQALHPARDVLAPAAGRLAAGEPLESLGERIDPTMLVPSLVAVPRTEADGSVTAEVLSVRRWGTVQLNVDREVLSALGELLVAEWTSTARAGVAAEPNSGTVQLTPPGVAPAAGLALSDDPYGLLELTVAGGSAMHLGFEAGTEVRLRRAT